MSCVNYPISIDIKTSKFSHLKTHPLQNMRSKYLTQYIRKHIYQQPQAWSAIAIETCHLTLKCLKVEIFQNEIVEIHTKYVHI